MGNLSERSCQLDSGRAAADYHEIQGFISRAGEGLAFGEFEGEQNAASNLEGIFNRLEAGRQRFPGVVAEIGVHGSGGDDQVVVGQFLLGSLHDAAIEVETLDFFEQANDVVLPAENGTDGRSDFGRGKSAGCDLVEQGLKGMVVFAVDDRDGKGATREGAGGIEAAEASSHDDYPGCAIAGHKSYL